MAKEKFVLLGKAAPNDWRSLGEIYDELNGISFIFENFELANIALCNMKNFLKVHRKNKKVPLTIRKITVSDDFPLLNSKNYRCKKVQALQFNKK